jgi:prepilin peptidase dependent protein B
MTLVELMVGSAISLVTLSTVVTVYSATAQHASRQLQEADLQQQIHALANQLASDLRRSGYWWFDPILTPAPENPFEQPGNRLRIDAMDNQPAKSCILYSYDLDADGLVGIGQCKNGKCGALTDEDNVEQFGFRFNNGRVQSRYGGRSLACNGGNWQTVTTANIVIDSLRFRLHSDCSNLTEREKACQSDMPSLQQRALEFQIAGHVEGRDTIRLDLSRWIHIRNNQLLEPQP